MRAAEIEAFQPEPLGLLGDETVLLALGEGLAVFVGQFLLDHFLHAVDQVPEGLGDFAIPFRFDILQVLFELLALFVGEAHAAGEFLRVDDDPFDAGRDLERIVLHILAGPAEDGVQQFLLGRELRFRLRRHLADEDVARTDVRSDLHDAVFVQAPQGLLADVGDVAGELLAAELGLADFRVEFLDVDRGIDVVLDQLLADDDRILEVEAVPGHECRQDVPAQGQLALVRCRAVGEHRPFSTFWPSCTIGFWFWQVRSFNPTNLRSL